MKHMKRHSLLLLLLLACSLVASRRGEEPRVQLELSEYERISGEAYEIELRVLKRGFVYLYSLDAGGYVNLLYPVLPEDGRGEVQSGDTLQVRPLYAGKRAGLERLVAVHTLEHRQIKTNRQHFKAPDPDDLRKIHQRLTRSKKETGNYSEQQLRVLGLDGAEDWAYEENEDVQPDTDTGLIVHHHHYDYWCSYCDCWHLPCSHDHCWCGWEVVHHYHRHFHYSHCYMWGHHHNWWRPPMVYIYVRGGSNWDYDTRPWRGRLIWAQQRDDSADWREEHEKLMKPELWADLQPRSKADKPHPGNSDKGQPVVKKPEAAGKRNSYWSTEHPGTSGSNYTTNPSKSQVPLATDGEYREKARDTSPAPGNSNSRTVKARTSTPKKSTPTKRREQEKAKVKKKSVAKPEKVKPKKVDPSPKPKPAPDKK